MIPALRRFKIVIVTDRIDLEQQLSATAQMTGEPIQKANKVTELERLLRQPGAGLVFGMIQKFRGDDDTQESDPSETLSNNLNPSTNILVLVDEAHRSHTNTLHLNLISALPNCARIGFTGTPIIKNAKQATQKIFGSFIDKYTIRESLVDKVTVPILYEGLEARATVHQGDDLDRLFDIIFRDKNPEEKAEIRRKYATKTEVSEAQELINAKAENMLRHYITRILPNGFKAQVVASSRKAAVRYVEAFLAAKTRLLTQLENRATWLKDLDENTVMFLDEDTQFYKLALTHLETLHRLDVAAVISKDKQDLQNWERWSDQNNQKIHIERYKKPLEQDGLAILVRQKYVAYRF
jgi:type I restriction enzyme R subunit